MSGEPAHLADQLCFSLYAASRAVTGAYRQGLSQLGLTYPQYITMLAMWESDGRTVRELGEALQLESGTLSPLLSRLESAGLIRKDRAGADGRSVTVWLTDSGRALQSSAAEVRHSVERATGLKPSEMRSLREALVALEGKLRP